MTAAETLVALRKKLREDEREFAGRKPESAYQEGFADGTVSECRVALALIDALLGPGK